MKIAVLVLLLHLIKCIRAGEVDVLTALKNKLTDPDNTMQSWDPTLTTPCTWFHITCDPNNSVIRVDLGKANVSGQLVPELGQLKYLQYLELYMNNISGSIPEELGNSSSLVSLDLYQNKLYGPIPDWLGGLTNLRFLRLNNNGLTGSIPKSLTEISTLAVLDLSCNDLSGTVPLTGSFLKFTPVSFRNNPQLCYPGVTCP